MSPTDQPTPSRPPTAGPAGVVDPVRARRQQIAHWTKLANRAGYVCYGLAIVAFVLAFMLGFSGAMATLIIASIVVGSILLAPTIVLGYAVKAAERDDRERGY